MSFNVTSYLKKMDAEWEVSVPLELRRSIWYRVVKVRTKMGYILDKLQKNRGQYEKTRDDYFKLSEWLKQHEKEVGQRLR